jgi:hypothetical protein
VDVLEHLEHYLGEARTYEEPTVFGRNRGYGLFFCYDNDRCVSVVTNGLRFQRITALTAQELVCTAYTDQRKGAHLLVPLTAELVLSRGKGFIYEEAIVGHGQPLIPGTAIEGVIATLAHPYARDGFDEGPGLRFVTLLPATGPELALAIDEDVEALLGVWEKEETDLLDLYRDSAVRPHAPGAVVRFRR